MTERRPYRAVVIGLCAVAAVAAAVAARGPTPADGPLLESLIAKRALFAPRPPPEASPVAVVAIDRRSLDAPEFHEVPRALMGARLAPVLDGLFAAGARAVGFDVIFAYSGDRIRPGFDDAFLTALARHQHRVVLARSEEMTPDISFAAAVGAVGLRQDPTALGLATVRHDPDGVFRRVYAFDDLAQMPGFAAALLQRAGGPAMPREVLLVPRQSVEEIPTYAVVDVLRCASLAPGSLTQAFHGRIVIVGGTLPEEDRKVAAGWLLSAPEHDGPPLHPCGLRRLGASAPGSGNVPGVYLHAAAVEAVATGYLTRSVTPAITAVLAGLAAAGGAAIAFAATPWAAVLAVIGIGVLVTIGAIAALAADVWIPIGIPLAAIVAAPALAYVARYLVEERTRRRIQDAFSHYLSPQIVDRLTTEPAALRLGGERRAVTVMFADLSGFTALSGRLEPEALTTLTNEYLGYIVDQVEATSGYVDKFIGDAVMAIWGAPVADTRHAAHAVTAALAAVSRIRQKAYEAAGRGEPAFSVKIGLNSGDAVVGNVGTERRYNYTAVGETVNVASRLEGVPSLYACTIVVGPSTAELARAEFVMRELDLIQVKGRDAPLRISEPIAHVASASLDDLERVRRYEEALALYRGRRFVNAAVLWEGLAKDEATMVGRPTDTLNPPSRMAERARALVSEPPPTSWAGIWVLTGK